jgi:pilus assembly protein CpaE
MAYGRVVMIFSPKGGAGCTTLATNLAVTLHNPESPVVLVDANLQFGDLPIFLNVQGRNSVVDLAPRVDELDDEVVNEVLIVHKDSGVKVLAAPFHTEQAADVSGEQFGRVINYLRRMFSYVIVNCPPYITDSVAYTIKAADIIVLVTTQDIPAIRNVRLFLDLASNEEIDRNKILLVMNRFDRRIGITPEKVSESFKHDILAVVPFDERTVLPAVNRGVPFMITDKKSPIARSILDLTAKIRQKLSELETRQEMSPSVRW